MIVKISRHDNARMSAVTPKLIPTVYGTPPSLIRVYGGIITRYAYTNKYVSLINRTRTDEKPGRLWNQYLSKEIPETPTYLRLYPSGLGQWCSLSAVVRRAAATPLFCYRDKWLHQLSPDLYLWRTEIDQHQPVREGPMVWYSSQ